MAKVSTSKEAAVREGAAKSYRADPARAAEAQPELAGAARVEAHIAQAAARQAMPEAARTRFREAVREEIAARIADDRLPSADGRDPRSRYREVIVLEGQAAKEAYARIQVDVADALGQLLRTERANAGPRTVRDQPMIPPGATVADVEIAGRRFHVHASAERVAIYEASGRHDRQAGQQGRREHAGSHAHISAQREKER